MGTLFENPIGVKSLAFVVIFFLLSFILNENPTHVEEKR